MLIGEANRTLRCGEQARKPEPGETRQQRQELFGARDPCSLTSSSVSRSACESWWQNVVAAKQELRLYSQLLPMPKKTTDSSSGSLVGEGIHLSLFSVCFCRDASSARSRAPPSAAASLPAPVTTTSCARGPRTACSWTTRRFTARGIAT